MQPGAWISTDRVLKILFSLQALQDLVEVVMSLKFAVEQNQGYPVEMSSGPLTDKLSQYASLLASQGALAAASTYLVST